MDRLFDLTIGDMACVTWLGSGCSSRHGTGHKGGNCVQPIILCSGWSGSGRGEGQDLRTGKLLAVDWRSTASDFPTLTGGSSIYA